MKLLKSTRLILLSFCLLFALTVLPAGYASAAIDDNIAHLYDRANLLTTSEQNELEAMCAEYSKKDNLNIIILTHADSTAVDAETYIEDFYDNNLNGDSVILLVDMYNRVVFIEGYGSAQNSINHDRINAIIGKITSDLENESYSEALHQYIKLTDKYINTPPIYENVWLHLGIAVLIGIITVSIMAYNAGGKMTVGGGTYLDPNHSGLIGRRDDYIRTHVTRVRKPQNNGGGGGGGRGGVSAGGHSHSSGGGRF